MYGRRLIGNCGGLQRTLVLDIKKKAEIGAAKHFGFCFDVFYLHELIFYTESLKCYNIACTVFTEY